MKMMQTEQKITLFNNSSLCLEFIGR